MHRFSPHFFGNIWVLLPGVVEIHGHLAEEVVVIVPGGGLTRVSQSGHVDTERFLRSRDRRDRDDYDRRPPLDTFRSCRSLHVACSWSAVVDLARNR